MAEKAFFWRIPEAHGAELLKARFITHAYDRHVHDRYVIGLVLQGAERFDYRGASHVIAPGDLAVLEPDTLHDGSPAVEGGWVYRVSYLAPEALAAAAEQVSGRPGLPRFPEVSLRDADLLARFRALHEAGERAGEGAGEGAGGRFGERQGTALARDAGWLETLADLVVRHARILPNAPEAGREPAAVARVRAYLDAHAAEEVRLEELAAVAGLAPLYLIRAFKRATGLPPHAYQIRLRVAEACRRLRAGEAPAEVAAACGFADQSHLTRLFKRAMGVTPGVYRTGSFKTR